MFILLKPKKIRKKKPFQMIYNLVDGNRKAVLLTKKTNEFRHSCKKKIKTPIKNNLRSKKSTSK